MNIPVFFNSRFVNENGFLTNEIQMFIDQLMQSLQSGISNNGFTFPQVDTATITLLEPRMPNGTAWFNTDLALPQMKTAPGVVKTFTLT